MNYFCASFLSGKLSSAAASQDFAKKALQRSTTDLKYSAMRSSRKKFVDLKTGTSEDFDAAYDHKGIVQVATQQNFEVVVMEEGVDVLLLLHAQSCEPCAHLVPYFKKMAERLKDLKLSTLRIARMDVTHQTPPPHLHLLGVGNLPTLILLPANAKHEPWNYYSGVGKPQDMMIWVQKLVNHQFELPNLPHLTGPERELYKAQIKEREAYMDELVSSNEVEL